MLIFSFFCQSSAAAGRNRPAMTGGKGASRIGRQTIDPGNLHCRWAPYAPAHEPAQGQLPEGSIRPREQQIRRTTQPAAALYRGRIARPPALCLSAQPLPAGRASLAASISMRPAA
eukprot:TRINITY_DN44634_c0_g1_i1.p3 TRINITY_DN44634_c0_g1~~TRINITY_DN44634_c0_g1_i1.p3  ORF type:complete len:116 (+),score=8.26 TRINITY_DN44634_c0_g1_i1:2-349(+)